jgi:hypothetical protein
MQHALRTSTCKSLEIKITGGTNVEVLKWTRLKKDSGDKKFAGLQWHHGYIFLWASAVLKKNRWLTCSLRCIQGATANLQSTCYLHHEKLQILSDSGDIWQHIQIHDKRFTGLDCPFTKCEWQTSPNIDIPKVKFHKSQLVGWRCNIWTEFHSTI